MVLKDIVTNVSSVRAAEREVVQETLRVHDPIDQRHL